jgi:hypothetical protein
MSRETVLSQWLVLTTILSKETVSVLGMARNALTAQSREEA